MNHQHLFLSCDWGTSSYRLRLIDKTNLQVIAQDNSDNGNAKVFEKWKNRKDDQTSRLEFYKSFIKESINQFEYKAQLDLRNVPLVISGMASSTIGMVELPYQNLPFNLDGSDLLVKTLKPDANFPYPTFIISGIKSETDVMRGEEIQLVGCYINNDTEVQVFIIPGTHSKHIFTVCDKAVSFSTYLTGELFSLLSTYSILANSIEAGGDFENQNNKEAFKKGLFCGIEINLLNALFQVRTNNLFDKLSKQENFYYLSGMLIGAEFKSLALKKNIIVTLISNDVLTPQYHFALKTLEIGSLVKVISVDEALIAGHLKVLNLMNANS